jgi:hypothetical protein
MKTYKIIETHTGVASSWGEVEWEEGEIVEIEEGITLSDMGIDSDLVILIN